MNEEVLRAIDLACEAVAHVYAQCSCSQECFEATDDYINFDCAKCLFTAEKAYDEIKRLVATENRSKRLDAIIKIYDKTTSELDATKAELESVKSKLHATKTELHATKTELHATKEELDATKTDLDATKAELHATKTELHATRTELHATRTELHATRTELKESHLELYATKTLIRDVRLDLLTAANDMDHLKEVISRAHAQVEVLKALHEHKKRAL